LRSDFPSVEQLEVICAVLADRAYKILGQLVSLVDIAADFANPTLFRGGGCLRSGLRLGLYIREIIRVGDRRDGGKNFRFGYVGNKQRVGARILFKCYLSAQKSVCRFRQIYEAVQAPFCLYAVEFVGVSAALKTEPFEQVERGLLGKKGQIETAVGENHVMRKIGFVDGNRNLLGRVGQLHRGVYYAAVVFAVARRGQNVQSVRKFEHGFRLNVVVHNICSFYSFDAFKNYSFIFRFCKRFFRFCRERFSRNFFNSFVAND
jgi:hypothetical protein